MAGCHGNGTQEVDAAANGNLAPVSDNGEPLRSSKLLHLPRFTPPRAQAARPQLPRSKRATAYSKSEQPPYPVPRTAATISCSRTAAEYPAQDQQQSSRQHQQPQYQQPQYQDQQDQSQGYGGENYRITTRSQTTRLSRPHLCRNISSRHAPTELYLDPRLSAYGQGGYYWVPGVWAAAPYTGALWTPGYWSYDSNRYGWHRGFWARYIGYYGGVNYGNGYVGRGYYGGYWNRDQFNYNRQVTNVNNAVIHNTYITNVTNVTTYNRVS